MNPDPEKTNWETGAPSGRIPRPLVHRWRDVRFRFAPMVMYAACIVAAVYLWNRHWTPGLFVGEVQSVVSNVASPLDGQVATLTVQPFDRVVKGQVIGRVTLSPAAASAGLAAIRTELQVMRARMTLDGQRVDQSYQQLRANQLNQKVDLAVAESKLRFAESELARVEKLRAEKISSQFAYDTALDARDSIVAEVKKRTELIAEMEKALGSMKTTLGTNDQQLVPGAIDAAIAAQEEEFRSLSESPLLAPIDGVVTRLYRQAGENVASGEPLIVISSERPDSIIGYIRQPVTFEPKVGDTVTVSTRRGLTRAVGAARIVRVGARVDPLVQMANETGFDPLRERGLSVLISLPENVVLFPGELVDLAIK